MKWKMTTDMKGTFKRKAEYEFPEITPEILAKAKGHTFKDPLLIMCKSGMVACLTEFNGEIQLHYYHSCNTFVLSK